MFKRHIASFSKVPIYLFSYETTSFLLKTIITLHTSVEEIRQTQIPLLIFQSLYPDLINSGHVFFTDASKFKKGNYIGFAFYSPTLSVQKQFRIHSYASIFTGECLAIIQTVDYILEHNLTKVTIFSDSRSVINIISSCTIDRDYNYLVLVLKNKLRSAYIQNIDISLLWIPAHVGILGNETADHLAKEAINKGSHVDYMIPHTDFFESVHETLNKCTKDTLLSLAKHVGSSYFNNFPITPHAWFSKLKLNRLEIVTTCRIRSNHYNLNYSFNRCNIVDSPSCQCGAPQQDINHVLWNCPLLTLGRSSLLESIESLLKKPPPYDVFDLLKKPSTQIIAHIISYLRKHNIDV